MSDEKNDSNRKDPLQELINNARSGLAVILESEEAAKKQATAAVESQKVIISVLAEAQTKLGEISALATQAVAAMTKVADDQAVVATKSAHIQKAQEHADAVRADLDRKLTAATQQATEAEGLKSRAQSAADGATALLADTRTIKGSVDKDGAAIATARKTAEESAVETKKLAEKSATVEEQVANYEKKLDEIHAKCTEELKRIDSLLPGATSAGLAHAFDERRKTFLKPQTRWQGVFVCSVLAIVVLALSGLWHAYHTGTIPSWPELARLWLIRFPVAAALVWLALHSSRESALAKRLEEDYGYKSAIASCFEGFQKKMSEIGKGVERDSALAKLLENTLATIASPPGRIYDRHKLTVTPADEFKEATKAAAEAANVLKPGGGK